MTSNWHHLYFLPLSNRTSPQLFVTRKYLPNFLWWVDLVDLQQPPLLRGLHGIHLWASKCHPAGSPCGTSVEIHFLELSEFGQMIWGPTGASQNPLSSKYWRAVNWLVKSLLRCISLKILLLSYCHKFLHSVISLYVHNYVSFFCFILLYIYICIIL